MISKGIEYRPTHDLVYLMEMVEKADASFSDHKQIADDLAPYAVLVRYEEGFDVSLENAKALFEKALKLREMVLKAITKK